MLSLYLLYKKRVYMSVGDYSSDATLSVMFFYKNMLIYIHIEIQIEIRR